MAYKVELKQPDKDTATSEVATRAQMLDVVYMLGAALENDRRYEIARIFERTFSNDKHGRATKYYHYYPADNSFLISVERA